MDPQWLRQEYSLVSNLCKPAIFSTRVPNYYWVIHLIIKTLEIMSSLHWFTTNGMLGGTQILGDATSPGDRLGD
jgi:hypothetical protein